MSVVSILDVKILNNPAPFNASYQFEITFESLENLQKDLEWKLTYVGSAQSFVSSKLDLRSAANTTRFPGPNMTKNLTVY